MEDAQIVALYWDRDQRAVQETAGKYGRFLEQIAWNILRSHDDAEECANDVYLHAWNAIPPTRPASLRAWLGRVVRNLSLDRWKRAQAQRRGGGMELLLGELDECVPAPHGVERSLEDREIAAEIARFLEGLPRESRTFFLRRYWSGEDLETIASRCGCGVGKVKSSLFRTRRALRAHLEREGIEL